MFQLEYKIIVYLPTFERQNLEFYTDLFVFYSFITYISPNIILIVKVFQIIITIRSSTHVVTQITIIFLLIKLSLSMCSSGIVRIDDDKLHISLDFKKNIIIKQKVRVSSWRPNITILLSYPRHTPPGHGSKRTRTMKRRNFPTSALTLIIVNYNFSATRHCIIGKHFFVRHYKYIYIIFFCRKMFDQFHFRLDDKIFRVIGRCT